MGLQINMLSYTVTVVMLSTALPAVTNGLYFHILEGESKCFIEEVPDETLVTGVYKTEKEIQGQWQDGPKGMGINVHVTDPSGNVIIHKDYEGAGKFAFNTHEPGEHTICLRTNSTRWFGAGKLRVHLSLQVGEAANDYNNIMKKEQLTQVETRLYQLLQQVRQISSEQSYQRTREATFREISESTNVRVLWWSIGQAAILIITGYLQLRHLRGFFEAKKLV